jgi:hypothetical protein
VVGVTGRVQGVQVRRVLAAAALLLFAAPLLLAGCTDSGPLDPVAAWHGVQGGSIAGQRPPPPGSDAPYPNLASVPARPEADDAAARARVAAGLMADQANAALAVATPIVLPAPARPGGAVAAPDSGASASLAAASKPASGPAASRAGTAPTLSVPVTPPPPAAIGAAMAVRPPPPPTLPGVAQVTAPAPPGTLPPPPPATATAVAVAFLPGSVELSPVGSRDLRSLAARRTGRTVIVAGYGDAPEGDPARQADALAVAWQRAAAIARGLAAAGVPAAAMEVTARATGQGGQARLAN